MDRDDSQAPPSRLGHRTCRSSRRILRKTDDNVLAFLDMAGRAHPTEADATGVAHRCRADQIARRTVD